MRFAPQKPARRSRLATRVPSLRDMASAGTLMAAIGCLTNSDRDWDGFRVPFGELDMEDLRPLPQLHSDHPALAHFSAETLFWLRLAHVSDKLDFSVPHDEDKALAMARAAVGNKLQGTFSTADSMFIPVSFHLDEGALVGFRYPAKPGELASVSLRAGRFHVRLTLQCQAEQAWSVTGQSRRRFAGELAQAVSDKQLVEACGFDALVA